MGEVITGVVADERKHGHRIAAHLAHVAAGGGGRLRGQGGREEHAVLPVSRLDDEWDRVASAAAEEDRVKRHAGGVVPFGGQDGALLDRRAEPRIGVRRAGARLGGPRLASPNRSGAQAATRSWLPTKRR